MKLKLKNPLAFFDLETTGINTVKDRIVEMSVLKIMPNGVEQLRTWRINPEMPIPTEASLIHGIYDTDVADKPPFKLVGKEIAEFLKGADLAGFNLLRFDVPVLVEEFLRAGISFDVSNKKIVDAQRIFHLMEPRTLGAAYKFYCGEELQNAHSAEADTIATYKVLVAQVERYEGVKQKDKSGKEYEPVQNDVAVLHNLSVSNQIDFAGRMIYNDKGIAVFNFGKHKDKAVLTVLEQEPQYYDWIMNSDFPLNTKQKLTELKLSMLKK